MVDETNTTGVVTQIQLIDGKYYNIKDTTARTALSQKVDKVTGKGLSTNDFTTAEKQKLAELQNYDDTGIKSELTCLTNTSVKNILKLDTNLPTSVNGLTVTFQEDGGICFNGTTTNDVTYMISSGSRNPDWTAQHLNQKLIMSGCPKGGDGTQYSIQFWKYDVNKPSAYDKGDGVTFIFNNNTGKSEDNTMWRVVILITKNVVCQNLTFYPMLRDVSIEDETYQPYAMSNVELTKAVLSLLETAGISMTNLSYTAETMSDDKIVTEMLNDTEDIQTEYNEINNQQELSESSC